MDDPLVSIVVPAYNEAAHHRRGPAPRRAHVPFRTRGDRCRRRLDRRHARPRCRRRRRAAHPPPAATPARAPPSATGIAASAGAIVLIQDADLEYDPKDLPKLLGPLLEGHADVVYGTRLTGRRASARAPLLALRGQPLPLADDERPLQHHDQRHGGRLQGLPRRPDPRDPSRQRRLPLRARSHRQGPEDPRIRLYEVPISYYGRTVAEGKKITWRDGLRAVGALARFRLRD